MCRRAGGGQGLLGPLKPARIRAVGLAMLSAVRFLHRDRLLVHHDIKPGNVLIMPDGSTKVRSQFSLLVATQLLNKKRSSAVTFPSCSSLFDNLVQLEVSFSAKGCRKYREFGVAKQFTVDTSNLVR